MVIEIVKTRVEEGSLVDFIWLQFSLVHLIQYITGNFGFLHIESFTHVGLGHGC